MTLADREGWWHDDADEVLAQFDWMLVGLMTVQADYVRYCARKGLDPATALPSIARLTGADPLLALRKPRLRRPGKAAWLGARSDAAGENARDGHMRSILVAIASAARPNAASALSGSRLGLESKHRQGKRRPADCDLDAVKPAWALPSADPVQE